MRPTFVVAVAALLLARVAVGCSDDDGNASGAVDGDGVTTSVASSTTESTSSTTVAPDAPTTSAAPATTTTSAAPVTTTTDAAPFGDLEQLAGLPWAGADGGHVDPLAAVEAFVAFFTERPDPPFGPDEVTVGEFAAGDSRSGEVEVTFTETTFLLDESRDVNPVATVFVRLAGPEDRWWVLGAVTETLVVTVPAADATIGSVFDLEFANRAISHPYELEVHAHGEATAGYRAVGTGGGVFAHGEYGYRIDLSSCEDAVSPQVLEDGTVIDFAMTVEACGGAGRAGEPGTLVLVHDKGVTTVPVSFG